MNTPDDNAARSVDDSTLLDAATIAPDGGLTAWLTVFGAFLIQLSGLGFVNAFGVFQDFYSQHYLTNVSSSTISWIGSTNTFFILSGGLFFGRLYDSGYFHWLVIGGCTLQTLCLFMLSLTQQNQFYQVFLSQGLGFGLAASMSYVPALAVLSQHFRKRVDLAMSIVASGAPIGSSLYTVMLNNLLNGNLGFANAIRITAAVNAVFMLIGCCLMRTRPLFPTTQIHYLQLLRTASVDYPYIVASVGLFLYAAGSFFPIFYIQLDSSMHALGTEFSFYTIVMLNGGNFVGRSTAGFISASCGLVNAVIAATFFSGIVTIAITGLSTHASAVCIAIFFGYFEGVYVALCAPLITWLTHDVSELGARLGISLFMAGLGSLIGTPLAGELLGSNYIWWRPALLCGCFIIASTVLFAITRFVLRDRKQTASETP